MAKSQTTIGHRRVFRNYLDESFPVDPASCMAFSPNSLLMYCTTSPIHLSRVLSEIKYCLYPSTEPLTKEKIKEKYGNSDCMKKFVNGDVPFYEYCTGYTYKLMFYSPSARPVFSFCVNDELEQDGFNNVFLTNNPKNNQNSYSNYSKNNLYVVCNKFNHSKLPPLKFSVVSVKQCS